jgi:hypothetical protein
MSMVAKILIVLNLILAVAVMGAAGAYLQSAENWKKSHEDLDAKFKTEITARDERLSKQQTALDEATRAKSTALQLQAAAEASNRTLTDNQAQLNKQLNDLNGSYTTISANLKDLQGNLDAARSANDKLQGEMKQADADKRAALEAQHNAETEQKRLTDLNNNLSNSLDAAQKDKVALADSLEAANTHLDMYKKKYPPIGLATKTVNAQILASNPEMDIYLISVGEADVNLADELTVYRGDTFIAQVVVDKVFKDKASVTVKRLNGKPMKKSDIKVGDKVSSNL